MLQARLESDMGEGIMLYPSLPRPAPRHHALLPRFMDSGFTGIFNVLELPSTAVPLGLSRGGLPLGLQLVGPRGGDHRTIGVAMAMENAGLAKYVPPPR